MFKKKKAVFVDNSSHWCKLCNTLYFKLVAFPPDCILFSKYVQYTNHLDMLTHTYCWVKRTHAHQLRKNFKVPQVILYNKNKCVTLLTLSVPGTLFVFYYLNHNFTQLSSNCFPFKPVSFFHSTSATWATSTSMVWMISEASSSSAFAPAWCART